MDLKQKKSGYGKLHSCYRENYQSPITMPYSQWINYVAQGQNTLYGDAIIPSGTVDDGAVYVGHVRQNPWTASYPYDVYGTEDT